MSFIAAQRIASTVSFLGRPMPYNVHIRVFPKNLYRRFHSDLVCNGALVHNWGLILQKLEIRACSAMMQESLTTFIAHAS
eukprot:7921619-Karenia_brevis.AAC.1